MMVIDNVLFYCTRCRDAASFFCFSVVTLTNLTSPIISFIYKIEHSEFLIAATSIGFPVCLRKSLSDLEFHWFHAPVAWTERFKS